LTGSNDINASEAKPDALVKVTEAARMLGVSPRTVWRMIADDQLTVCRVRSCTRLSLAQVSSFSQGKGKVGGV
jgi:excisionase family DNA binding protein